jgi:hypothetical protein
VLTKFILSDLLFVEGALSLVFGAVFAGFSLYTMVRPSSQVMAEYIKSVFSWETVKREQDIPSTLRNGLILLGVGVVCIIAAIAATL